MKDEVRLGLKENWKQFVLLVIVNFFVGGMHIQLRKSTQENFCDNQGFGEFSCF